MFAIYYNEKINEIGYYMRKLCCFWYLAQNTTVQIPNVIHLEFAECNFERKGKIIHTPKEGKTMRDLEVGLEEAQTWTLPKCSLGAVSIWKYSIHSNGGASPY